MSSNRIHEDDYIKGNVIDAIFDARRDYYPKLSEALDNSTP